jgi:hypothetical protein
MWELSEDIMGQELLEATEELEKKVPKIFKVN